MSIYKSAILILKDKINSSRSGDRLDESMITFTDDDDIYTDSLRQAVHEMIWTIAQEKIEEEPLTASLIGGLTSNLGWYSLLAFLDDGLEEKSKNCDIYWAQQSRHVERWRGADFGIARRAFDTKKLHISLYQAKVADSINAANVYRSPNSDIIRQADKDLHNLIFDIKQEQLPDDKLHQIHKLYKTWRSGLSVVNNEKCSISKPEWVRYVFWHLRTAKDTEVPVPSVRSLPAILGDIASIRRRRLTKRFMPKDFKVSPYPCKTTETMCGNFIIEAAGDAKHDLIVDDVGARDLLKTLSKIWLPDFVIIDETGDPASELILRDIFYEGGKEISYKNGTREINRKLEKDANFQIKPKSIK